jgi:polyphosphate kinase
MKRNLDDRIEVLTPIREPALQSQLRSTLDLLLENPRQRWELMDRTWARDESSTERGVHELLLEAAPFS